MSINKRLSAIGGGGDGQLPGAYIKYDVGAGAVSGTTLTNTGSKSSGNGTIVNGSMTTDYSPDLALQFNGSSTYVTFGFHAADLGSPYTQYFLFHPDRTDQTQFLISNYNPSIGYDQNVITFADGSGTSSRDIFRSFESNTANGTFLIATSPNDTFFQNRFNFFAVVNDNSSLKNYKVSTNLGVELKGSDTSTDGTVQRASHRFNFGYREDGSSNHIKGALSYYAAYKEAHTTTQILAQFNAIKDARSFNILSDTG